MNQLGDTIVEVLIAMAVVSLVLAGAYVSTIRNVRDTQTAQERNQALQLTQSQVEFLRDNPAPGPGTACYDLATGAATSSCTFKADGKPNLTGDEPAFKVAITTVSGSAYVVTTRWAALGGNGDNSVRLYYRPVVNP